MPTLSEVRAAIKTTLEANLPGVTVYSQMAGEVNVPAVIVRPLAADFTVAFGRGMDTWQFDLVVLVARADDVLAQTLLDPYVDGGGTSSIRKVLFVNRTLGLANTAINVESMSAYGGAWDVGSYTYAGASLRLAVNYAPN